MDRCTLRSAKKMPLTKLFRPDRNLLRLICHPSKPSLVGEVFEFSGPLFISEVFCNLPTIDIDLSVLDTAFLNDIWFQELPLFEGQEKAKDFLVSELRATNINKFIDLLQTMKRLLHDNIINQTVKLGYRLGDDKNRLIVDETVFIETIERALDFISTNQGVYTLEFYYADEWL